MITDESQGEPPSSDPAEDPRLVEAMREYMAALDAGKRVNRRELIARHPDIAAELSACLQGLSFIQGAAGQLSDAGGLPPVASASSVGGISGMPLGDYRLVREIGRGGMGVVYEATQLSLGRQVAVKVLPMAAALDPRRLQRFRNEAQAAAGLHHTNIVPVYAVGCERSTHFYAMQLIEGRSLAEVIREARSAEANGTGRRRPVFARRLVDRPEPSSAASGTVDLSATAGDHTQRLHQPAVTRWPDAEPASGGASTVASSASWSGPRPTDALSTMHGSRRSEYFRTVAKLGVQAAEALDYAHGLGIIHRDIKPANLMVDGRGNLWVTDFGLAQMYGDNNLTQTGDMVGTARYMSPEQAGTGGRFRGRRDDTIDSSGSGGNGSPVVLDPRTDIYSLGVTLYELLTLQPAVPGRTRDELARQLADGDPRPARAVDRTVPVELQTILAKAYAKDPADRYPTARAFADDLKRFLADEPIHARPPTVWDHAVKWTRRHRSLALSAIVVLLLATAGLAATTLVVTAEKTRAQLAYQDARRQREVAEAATAKTEAAYRQARSTVDALARVAAYDMPRNPHTAATRRVILNAVLDYYKKVIQARRGDGSASDPDLLAAQKQWADMLAELTATDQAFRDLFNVKLLCRPAVKQDLHLSQVQQEDAEDLAASVVEPDAIGPGSIPAGDEADMARAGERLHRGLTRILGPAQLDRLAQISRQYRGVLAFDDPEVREKLNLTRDQLDALHQIRIGGPRDEWGRGPDGPPPDGFGGAGGRSRDHGPFGDQRGFDRFSRPQLVGQVLAALTPEQRVEWQELIGTKLPDADNGPPFRRGFNRPNDGPPGD